MEQEQMKAMKKNAQKMRCVLRGFFIAVVLGGMGCRAAKDQGNSLTTQGDRISTSPTQEPAVPLAGSGKIISDVKAAGFSVADPTVHWGVTVVVDTEHATGGFSAETQERLIRLHWPKDPDANSYEIFRSNQPVIPLMMETTLTMNAGGNSSRPENQWSDNQVVPATRYYYFILAIRNNGDYSVVATGNAVTPASRQPQMGLPQGKELPGSVDPEEAERKVIRDQDGVTSLDMGQNAANAPNGTYAFAWNYDIAGDFLLGSENERNRYANPFEIHKLQNGKYRLVGYVDTDTLRKTRESKIGIRITIYPNRSPSATEIVSLPFERLSTHASPETIMLDGKPSHIIHTDWKSSPSDPDTDPSTQPAIVGRDTPARAMNMFSQALETTDFATVADSFYMPEDTDGSCRHARAMVYFHFRELYRAIKEHFGPEGEDQVFHEFEDILPHKHSAEDFQIEPEPPHMAVVTPEAQKRGLLSSLRRGDDGIWRIGGRHPLSDNEMRSIRNNLELVNHIDDFTGAIKRGKYATLKDLVHDISGDKEIGDKMYKW
jgi:hypothetical protein